MRNAQFARPEESRAANSALRNWWHLLFGLIIALGVQAAITFQLLHVVTQRILMQEAAVTQDFLQSVVIAENSQDKLFREPFPDPALNSFANHVGNLPGILRANIYSPDGFIRHSSEPNLVGLKFSDNPELADAFAGRITISLEKIAAAEKPEHMALQSYSGSELIEAYIPLADAANKVFGVVEYYKKPQDLASAISEVRRAIWISAALIGLVFGIAWAWLIWRSMSEPRTRGAIKS